MVCCPGIIPASCNALVVVVLVQGPLHQIWKRKLPYDIPDSSVGKEITHNAGDVGSIPGSGRSAREGIGYLLQYSKASLVAHLVKNPFAMRENWVQSLRWENDLEKGKDTPPPVFWPGEFHGLYNPWDHKETWLRTINEKYRCKYYTWSYYSGLKFKWKRTFKLTLEEHFMYLLTDFFVI